MPPIFTPAIFVVSAIIELILKGWYAAKKHKITTAVLALAFFWFFFKTIFVIAAIGAAGWIVWNVFASGADSDFLIDD